MSPRTISLPAQSPSTVSLPAQSPSTVSLPAPSRPWPAAFQVLLVRPDGYVHAAAFAEVMTSVVAGLRGLGIEVHEQVNRLVVPGPTAIVFGANLLEPHEAPLLPEGTVIYNLEQIGRSSVWCSPTYLQLLKSHRVWDYSARNIASLAQLGVTSNAVHVPIGYVPELSHIAGRDDEDIDVLFYGSINDRRAKVINDLKALGFNAHAVFGVYGQARDELVARAKVVLNLHYYETSIFELVRVSYLLANHKAVVAEAHDGTEIDPDMVDAVRLARYEELVPSCAELVRDKGLRVALAERGFSSMARRDQKAYLVAALNAT